MFFRLFHFHLLLRAPPSPYSFKTKGNLTKHMKSKAHYKKCTELGLNPWPATIDDDSCLDDDHEDSSMASSSCGERTNHMADGDDDSDTDDISDGEDGENESTGKLLFGDPFEKSLNICSWSFRHRRTSIPFAGTRSGSLPPVVIANTADAITSAGLARWPNNLNGNHQWATIASPVHIAEFIRIQRVIGSATTAPDAVRKPSTTAENDYRATIAEKRGSRRECRQSDANRFDQ